MKKAARQKQTADLLKQIGFFGHFVILVKTLVRKIPGKIKVPQNSKKHLKPMVFKDSMVEISGIEPLTS